MHKYPRTRHVRGSRFQHGDYDLEAASWDELDGKHLVVEEKVDGANCGISFDEDANLLLQSRGHYLRGGPRERQFDLFKRWANENVDMLFDLLGSRYVLYGEWLYAKHTFFYDALPSYFMEFDMLDQTTGDFLSTSRRRELIGERPISQVLVLHEGPVKDAKTLAAMITRSHFITDNRKQALEDAATKAGVPVEQALKETDLDERMEGLYIKAEEDGKVVGRYKFVRESFTNAILDSETHWHDRTIIPNGLVK
jgi:hypothetical protein